MPELTGVGKYTGGMAEWLSRRGHKVKVITAPPYYPSWKISAGYSGWRFSREEIGGISVWRCPLYVPKKRSGLRRVLHLMSFAISSLPVMISQAFWRPEIVLAVAPPIICSPTARFVAWLSRAKAWLHIQDFEIEAALKLDLVSKKSIFAKFAQIGESWFLRRSHLVSTISIKMAERLLKKGLSKQRIVIFPNWASTELRPTTSGQRMWRHELGVGEKEILLLYAGNIGIKQGLDIVLEAATDLQADSRLHFVIAGDGVAKTCLQENARKLSLRNVRFLPVQPDARFVDLMAAADIHLVIQKAAGADLFLPSKVTNIMAAGGPMIVTAESDTELGQLVDNHQVGFRVEPEAVAELKEAIDSLANDPNKREFIGRKAGQYAEEHLNKEHIMLKFEKELLALRKG